MELFKPQSHNPVSHVVVNISTSSVVYKTEECWKSIVVADLLNQVEFCNQRIALLGAIFMDAGIFKFVSEYYRVTRQEAINAVSIIGGENPIKYCFMCGSEGRKVQATYRLDDGVVDIFVCSHHNDSTAINIERIW